ncbi:PIG-L deacetylase family protein [Paracoccus siganidrum]|uniref:PIG-L family deacetylase n=1 Tax=Paracoccus siganidrum TaxID=1276757 RepID=A0A419A9W2_9RHOB|nr:PIG-L deacetylase family protein [Paracoccus siganidrum]RJL19332.1 hypothetical protein D3P05_05435 [Paracoccus siganidrum]RMC33095.1 hypothetical protein C9E82_14225 [Paracoccus siganidrum]
MLQFSAADAGSTVMAVFAHPDDAELSCFGLLSKLRDAGWTAIIVIATRGENGADASQWDRVAEARQAAGLIGAQVVFGTFADGSVPATRALTAWVEELLQAHRPALVVTHFAGEARLAHQDHVAVGAAVHLATRRADWLPTLILSEGVEGDPSFRPNWFVDIGDHYDRKLRALAIHASQAAKPYMRAGYTELRARRWDLYLPAAAGSDGPPRFWEAFMMVRQVV